MKKLTLENLNALIIDSVFIELVADFLHAEARARTVREEVDAYEAPIFERLKDEFTLDPRFAEHFGDDFEFTPDNLYLCDADTDSYREFLDACAEAHIANGYEDLAPAGSGKCPALVCEHKRLKAKLALVKYGCEYLGVPEPNLPKHTDKMHDLLLGATLAGPAAKSLRESHAKKEGLFECLA